jgi:hypothetical protein
MKGNKKRADEVKIQWVPDGKATKGWIHTHGMDQHGLPELEMRDIPNFLGEYAADLLEQVCDYMLESGMTIRLGETMAISSRTQFRFVLPVPIPGHEDHYATERWQIVDVECCCENCGLKPSELN